MMKRMEHTYMNDKPDFLVRWDAARGSKEAEAMLAAEFEDAEERRVFLDIVESDLNRAMFEFLINDSIRFEDWDILRGAELIFATREFAPDFKLAGYEIDFLDNIVVTPGAKDWVPDIPNGAWALELIEPYIGYYVHRSTEAGIVAGRDAITTAFAIRDIDILGRLRETRSGKDILPEDYSEIWQELVTTADPARNIAAARRKAMRHWRDAEGVHFHDTSELPPAAEYFDFDDDESFDAARKIYPQLSYHQHYIETLRQTHRMREPVAVRPLRDSVSW